MGSAQVVGVDVARDSTLDLGRIEAGLLGRLEGNDLPVADGGGQVRSECRDPAALRRVGGNEGSLRDSVKSSRGAC